MNKIISVIAFACISNLALAQHVQEPKTDSASQLVRKYCNEKSAEELYGLTGEAFKKAISPDAFKAFCEQNLFPLGEFKEAVFENYSDGISRYRAVFKSVRLTLLLSLDKANKIETFQFLPYVDDKEKKKDKVSSTNKLKTPLDREVDSAVQPYINMPATTGLSIGILKDGKTIFYGYGETAKGNKKIPDENTLFEIGSISKTFTATLVADAAIHGKIKLSDPINRYMPDSIPNLMYEGNPITIESLANHSSGIPSLPSNFNYNDAGNPYKDYDYHKLFIFYVNYKPARKPGEKYEYSNLAVGTLGVILERIYGKPYEAIFLEKICDPLNMKETRQFLRKHDSARFAKGYNDKGIYNSQWDFKALAGAGAIRSTASDLLKYANANLGTAPSPLNEEIQLTHKITFTSGATKVGLAWHFIKPGIDELIFHNGGTGGYRSYLAINPQRKFAVVILSNTAIGVEGPGNAIMKWLETN